MQRQAEIDERRSAMEESELNARATMNMAVRDYNMALADGKREKEMTKRMEDGIDAVEEIRCVCMYVCMRMEDGIDAVEEIRCVFMYVRETYG
jgi:hypothetical protein